MIRIAITDDDKETSVYLKEIVAGFFSKKAIQVSINIYRNGEALLESDIKFDMIFLDIMMGNIDGIETAKFLRKKDKNVVLFYVSSYSEYIKKSFSVHPFAFIEKPIDKHILISNLNDYIHYVNQDVEKIYFDFDIEGRTAKIPVSEILYLEYVENRKIKMKTVSNIYYIKGAVSSYYSQLKSYDFIMPHRSFIINMSHIKNYLSDIILMSDDYNVPVSTKRKKIIESEISDFIHRDL